jgi:hypothetical protein
VVAEGVTSEGAAIWPEVLTTMFEPLTSSLRGPLSVRVTPAVGMALQRAAAASTMAVACWLVTWALSGPRST